MVKYIHNLEIAVFYKPSIETFDEKELLEKLKVFAGLKDTSSISVENLSGSDDLGNDIGGDLKIFKIKKDKGCEGFIKDIFCQINKDEVIKIKDSIDEDANFYLRLDKTKYLNEGKFESVTHGNCIHIRVKLAAYPAKQEVAKKTYDAFIDMV